MPDLSTADIRVFVEAVSRYFTRLTREAPRVRGAYLAIDAGPPPELEYSGIIVISGAFCGQVCVTAPRALLRHLLVSTGESDQSEEAMLDIIGEMANTISGNARHHFGHGLEISVPVAQRSGCGRRPAVRSRPYIVSLDWKNYAANVVVDLQRSDRPNGAAEGRLLD